MKRFLSIIACLVLCFALCVPAFAEEVDIPAFPAFSSEIQSIIDEYNLKTVVVYDTKSTIFYALLIRNSDDFLYNQSAQRLVVNPERGSVSYASCSYSNGSWTCWAGYGENFKFSASSNYWLQIGGNCLLYGAYTTAILHNVDGTVFFAPPRPLTEQLQTQAGELTQTQIAETLDFLVPLGIGLMALLISSVLLRKVFRVFL